MTYDLLLAFVGFAFVSSVTPGPNNLMLMASGANFGFRRTIPHMLGVAIGFTLMIVLVGTGLLGLFDMFPVSYVILKTGSVIYLLYLAWKVATATPVDRQVDVGRPMSFMQAASFQWVNPKAWAMALTAISIYAPDRSISAILLVAAIFGAINMPCISSWTMLGQQLARILKNPRQLRVFNGVMAALLVASLYPVLWPS